MKTALDTVVAKWLDDSVANETVSTQFKEGMERLVKNMAEDPGDCRWWLRLQHVREAPE